MKMAKFYVFSGRKALWNLVILLLVIAALVYMFRVEEVVNSGEDVTTEFDQSLAQVVLVEPVTVRTVPTKFSEYKLERERMRSRQVELLQESGLRRPDRGGTQGTGAIGFAGLYSKDR